MLQVVGDHRRIDKAIRRLQGALKAFRRAPCG
jgi:hypothetical protein